MIDQSTLVTYLLVLTGFVIIPGPAVLLTFARASNSGPRAGLATGLGIAAGDLLHTVAAAVGISAVILASATVFSVIKWLGAAYQGSLRSSHARAIDGQNSTLPRCKSGQ